MECAGDTRQVRAPGQPCSRKSAAPPVSRMLRTLQPELLDSLPHDHPDALHNRRDLRLTNQIIGNHRWLARTLPPLIRPGERTLELGAGTGELGRRLVARGVTVDGLDRWPRPDDWAATGRWHVGDLRTFEGYADYAVVVGNLIFHQFSDAELAALGEKLRASVRVIVACEPARRRISQVLYRALAPLCGAGAVSLHDAHVSIAAGFRGTELPDALQLPRGEWKIRCHATALGAYRMVAERQP